MMAKREETAVEEQSNERGTGIAGSAATAEMSSEELQPGLFPDDSIPDDLVGYRVPSACQIAGINVPPTRLLGTDVVGCSVDPVALPDPEANVCTPSRTFSF